MFSRLSFLFLLFLSLHAGAQSVRFEKAWLDEPRKHGKELEKSFKIVITKKVNAKVLKSTVALENGYAHYEIANAEPWYQVRETIAIM